MPFNQNQEAVIIKALGDKITQPCPACDRIMRQLIPDLYLFQLHTTIQKPIFRTTPGGQKSVIMPPPGTITSGINALPSVVVVCGNCGFTEFYNVHRLGVAGVLGLPDPGVPLADKERAPQPIGIAPEGVTVKIAPTVITLHRLTTDQLESLAITNGLTAISLGFLGMAFGALVSYQTALATSNFRDEIGRVAFESYKTSAITLTAFFAVVFIGSLIFSVRKLWRGSRRENYYAA